MIRVGIIGVTGYTGAELVRILLTHENVKITRITSRQYSGKYLSSLYPSFRNFADFKIEDYDENMSKDCDVIFTALPHKIPMKMIPELIDNGVKVVDLSADFRFKSRGKYESHYCPHEAPEYIDKAVYGLCEINKNEIASADLVGNPGCYPTCSLLGIIPFLKNNEVVSEDIIIDAKSGVSGAGKSPLPGTHFCEVNENFKAYKVAEHRHRPEIEEKLSIISSNEVRLSFTPHLLPATRGMLATSYLKSDTDKSESKLRSMLEAFYSDSKFVRILPENEMPSIKNVIGTNFCDINFKLDPNTNRIIVVSVIDNLMKGASGQAVQNMNLMFGFDEDAGLKSLALPV